MAHVFEQQTKSALLVARVILVARKMSNINIVIADRLAFQRKPQFVNCETHFLHACFYEDTLTYIGRSTSETISRLTEAQNSASVSVYRDPEPVVRPESQTQRGDGGFPIQIGGGFLYNTYPDVSCMYPACILHVF